MNNTFAAPDTDESIDTALISVERLPIIISKQVDELNKLDKQIQLAESKARSAKHSATEAKKKSAGIFKKKSAIEALQSSNYDTSVAAVSLSEAQKIGFEFQTKLAEITKYLFALGVGNIAQNRVVIRELEHKLQGASANQLSVLARKEMLTVVMQLKAQEDMFSRHERLANKVRAHDDQLHIQIEKDVQHDGLIDYLTTKEHQHNDWLQRQSEKDKLHDEALRMLAEKCDKLENALALLQVKSKALTEFTSGNFNAIEKQAGPFTQLKPRTACSVLPLNRPWRYFFAIAIVALIGTLFLYVLRLYL